MFMSKSNEINPVILLIRLNFDTQRRKHGEAREGNTLPTGSMKSQTSTTGKFGNQGASSKETQHNDG